MGITCGWLSAEVEAAELADAMLRAWRECEVVRTVEGTGLDLLYDEDERVGREEKALDQALSAWGFYQVGNRAVCVDPRSVVQTEDEQMRRLSKLVGPTLSLTLGTHGGVAGFILYDEGQVTRRVWYENGELDASGSPLDEEEGLPTDRFYWDECELLWDAFELGKLGEWNDHIQVLVVRDHATERFLAELEEKGAGEPRPIPQRPESSPIRGTGGTAHESKPWWRFW